jgi:hypothetical protein
LNSSAHLIFEGATGAWELCKYAFDFVVFDLK